MPSPYELAMAYRAALLERERSAVVELVDLYRVVWARLRRRTDALLAEITAARDRGDEVSPAWLSQLNRLDGLLGQVETEIRQFSAAVGTRVGEEITRAASLGRQEGADLIRAAMGAPPPRVTTLVVSLPTGAVESLAGFLSPGAPLNVLLSSLGPAAARRVQEVLVTGLAAGEGVREIARGIRRAAGEPLVRALTIARTETLRAYREGQRATFAANPTVVKGWIWAASLDRRTCAYCWAMHGTEHPIGQPMATHPNCRCVQMPKTASWRELGIDLEETAPRPTQGVEMFAKQPAALQAAVLGPAKYRAYQAGAIRLEDLVGQRRDRVWGPTGFERSLASVLGRDARRYYGSEQRDA